MYLQGTTMNIMSNLRPRSYINGFKVQYLQVEEIFTILSINVEENLNKPHSGTSDFEVI